MNNFLLIYNTSHQMHLEYLYMTYGKKVNLVSSYLVLINLVYSKKIYYLQSIFYFRLNNELEIKEKRQYDIIELIQKVI